mmetsp:Transcript_17734/g.36724  ORF Transcript_17734/g.36724 Transcript_17734/m.36724 type:complete len:217 (-) Transcript_17734:346-996(-)
MMPYQQGHGQGGKRSSHHGQMRSTPHDLSDKLWMPGNTNHARFPQVNLRFLNRRHFLEIEDGRIQEEEAQEINGPRHGMGNSVGTQIIKLHPIVGMGNKVGDPTVGQTQTGKGKNDAPHACSHDLFSQGPQRGQTRMYQGKDNTKEQGHHMRIAPSNGFQKGQKVIRISRRWVHPQNGHGRQNGTHGGGKGKPSSLPQGTPIFVLNVKQTRIFSHH